MSEEEDKFDDALDFEAHLSLLSLKEQKDKLKLYF